MCWRLLVFEQVSRFFFWAGEQVTHTQHTCAGAGYTHKWHIAWKRDIITLHLPRTLSAFLLKRKWHECRNCPCSADCQIDCFGLVFREMRMPFLRSELMTRDSIAVGPGLPQSVRARRISTVLILHVLNLYCFESLLFRSCMLLAHLCPVVWSSMVLALCNYYEFIYIHYTYTVNDILLEKETQLLSTFRGHFLLFY